MPPEKFVAWQKSRLENVQSPNGNLALVGYQSVTERAPVELVPGLVVEPSDDDGVYLTPEENVSASVDGTPVEGRTFVPRLRPDGTPLISADRYTIDVFSLDGSDYELRIYDPEAEARQNFVTIECFDHNPDAVFTGSYRPFPETEKVPWDFTRQSDSGHTKSVPGIVDITIDGNDYSMVAFLNGPTLVLVYTDGTSGKEAYGAGKFLVIPPADDDGTVELDFNHSFIPPCGFSMYYSCPMAPPANRISTPLRAGEKIVVFNES